MQPGWCRAQTTSSTLSEHWDCVLCHEKPHFQSNQKAKGEEAGAGADLSFMRAWGKDGHPWGGVGEKGRSSRGRCAASAQVVPQRWCGGWNPQSKETLVAAGKLSDVVLLTLFLVQSQMTVASRCKLAEIFFGRPGLPSCPVGWPWECLPEGENNQIKSDRKVYTLGTNKTR